MSGQWFTSKLIKLFLSKSKLIFENEFFQSKMLDKKLKCEKLIF